MTTHKDSNGKPKCGARQRYGRFALYITNNDSEVTCKRCSGTSKKPQKTETLTEDIIGKLLHYSWGYDMTINEFYVITKQTPHSVLAEKIGTRQQESSGYGYGAGTETPDTALRTGLVVRFLAKKGWNNDLIFLGNGACASLHNGESMYFNTND